MVEYSASADPYVVTRDCEMASMPTGGANVTRDAVAPCKPLCEDLYVKEETIG